MDVAYVSGLLISTGSGSMLRSRSDCLISSSDPAELGLSSVIFGAAPLLLRSPEEFPVWITWLVTVERVQAGDLD
jgi:hypothetical protein